jgi:RHS repeat-associated protein
MINNAQGQPTLLQDATGAQTQRGYDSRNRLEWEQNAVGSITRYQYNSADQVVRITSGETATTPPLATTIYTYTASRLTSMRRPDGVVVSYSYENTTFPLLVSEETVGVGTSMPLRTRYNYDTFGRVRETLTAFGTPLVRSDWVNYNPDNTVALTIQNHKDGTFDPARPDEDIRTSYRYDGLGRLVATTDVYGRVDATRYNAKGQVEWQVQNLVPANYDAHGQPIIPAFDPAVPDRNVGTQYSYDGLGRVRTTTEFGILTGTFDPVNRRFGSATSRTTQITYDTQSRPTTVIENLRTDLPTTALDANLTTESTYDDAGKLTWQRDPLGRWTKFEYDAASRLVKTIRNHENGNPSTINPENTGWATLADTDLTTVTTYDALGQVTATTTAAGQAADSDLNRTQTTSYDPLGRIQTQIALAGSSAPRTTTMQYDPLTGQVRATQDALGRWTTMRYDARGFLISTTVNCRDAAGNPVDANCAPANPTRTDRNVSSAQEYDVLGRVVRSVDVMGVVTTQTYDGLGRTTAVTRNVQTTRPATPTENVTTRTRYDALGRVVATVDSAGATTTMRYDGLGRLSEQTDPMGRVMQFGSDRDGVRWERRVADGRLTVYLADRMGRTVRTIVNYQDGVRGPGELDYTTLLVYDRGGRMVQRFAADWQVTNVTPNLNDQIVAVTENAVSSTCTNGPCNVVTRFGYDRAGNRVTITDPRGFVRTFRYTTADQLDRESDGVGVLREYRYDSVGRLAEEYRTGWVTYEYDEADRVRVIRDSDVNRQVGFTRSYNFANQLVFETPLLMYRPPIYGPSPQIFFQYDPLGRMAQVSYDEERYIAYEYDFGGRIDRIRYPDGTQVDRWYYADGTLWSVRRNNAQVVQYSYDAVGRLSGEQRANGTSKTYNYDGLDRVTSHSVWLIASVNATIYGQSITYNQAGDIERTSESFNNGTSSESRTFTYDGLRRLFSMSSSPSGSTNSSAFYRYDLAGNRTRVDQTTNGVTTTQERTYNERNQVNGWQYDGAGNLLNDGQYSYEYTIFGQLKAATRQQGNLRNEYRYNSEGVLTNIKQTNSTTTTNFTPDFTNPLPTMLSDGTTNIVYGRGNEQIQTVTAGTATWFTHDHLGSTRQTVTNSGTVAGSARYDPWGAPLENTTGSRVGFTGELTDNGLVYLRARWYNPNTGTFTSRDPFPGVDTVPQSLHPYAYTHNNPVNATDPSGKCVFPELPDELRRIYCNPLGYLMDSFVQGVQSEWQSVCQGIADGVAAFMRLPPTDFGLVVGGGLSGEAGFVVAGVSVEKVYDLYTFETGVFTAGYMGGNTTAAGFDLNSYGGIVLGWSSFDTPTIENYSGYVVTAYGGVTLAEFASLGLAGSLSTDETRTINRNMGSLVLQGSLGFGLNPLVVGNVGVLPVNKAVLIPGTRRIFRSSLKPTLNDAVQYALALGGEVQLSPTQRKVAIAVVLRNGYAWQFQP